MACSRGGKLKFPNQRPRTGLFSASSSILCQILDPIQPYGDAGDRAAAAIRRGAAVLVVVARLLLRMREGGTRCRGLLVVLARLSA